MRNQLSWGMVTAIALLCVPLSTSAQLNGAMPKVTTAYYLQNVNVVVSPGSFLENTNVLIENGLIQTIGSRTPVPSHAKVIQCDSMYVYAGFIEGVSHTGIPAKEKEANSGGSKPKIDRGNPPNDAAGIRPEREVRDLYVSSDKSVTNARKLGFTASHVVPKDGMLPGKGSLVLLGDGATDEMILKEDVSLYFQLSPARRIYPGTVIGVMSKWRELYRQATYFKKHKKAFEGDGDGIGRPKYDRATEALFPVVNGELPVFFKSPNALDAYKAFALQDELGYEMALVDLKEGWRVTDQLAERKTPVFLSMDLPEDQEKKKKDDDDEVDEAIEKMKKRRQESLLQHYSQAAVIAKTGIPMSFSMINSKPKEFHANGRKMIENGLSSDTLLAALTTIPAKMFGVEKYMGTVTAGKMANLVVSTGRYFAEDSQVRYVFVEGKLYEYDIKKKKEKKKSDGDSDDEPASITGNWSFEVEVPGDSQTGTISISGADGDFEGKLIPDDEDGDETDLDNIAIEGNVLTFTMVMEQDGGSMTLDFELTIEDGAFTGEVSVGEFGSFPIEGERLPKS